LLPFVTVVNNFALPGYDGSELNVQSILADLTQEQLKVSTHLATIYGLSGDGNQAF